MPSPQQEKLMEFLAAETGPISASELAKKAGLTTESTSTQLSRVAAKEAMVVQDNQGEWLLTEAGREYLGRLTQETAGTSEYEIFMSLGRRIGVVGDLIPVVAEHVWSGGDYEDVDWVWKALGQMDIRSDQKKRWWNAWRSHLGKAIPPDLKEEMAKASAKGEQEEEGETKKEGRDYIIIDDVPFFAGEGQGDMSLKDAKDVISMRSLRSRLATSQGGGSPQSFSPKDVIDIIDRINEGRGNVAQPSKSYVVTPTPEGTQVEEIEEGRPIVLPPQPSTPPTSFLVDHEGNLKEVQPGQPIVVKQPAPAPSHTPIYFWQDGALKRLEPAGPGEPVIINMPAATPPNPSSLPMQLTDKDGNPVVMDINSVINWKRFEGDEKRADEKVDTLKKLLEFVRTEGPKAIEALKVYASRAGGIAPSTEASQGPAIEATCSNCQQPFILTEMPTGEFPCPHCGATLSPPQV